MQTKLQNILIDIQEKVNFSGTVLVENQEKVALVSQSFGYANRSEQIDNHAKLVLALPLAVKFLLQSLFVSLLKREASI